MYKTIYSVIQLIKIKLTYKKYINKTIMKKMTVTINYKKKYQKFN